MAVPDEINLTLTDNAMQTRFNTQQISYIFFIPGYNLSPYNYCMYVLVLIIFQHVNAFPGTEAEQMHRSTDCFFLVNGHVFPIRQRKPAHVFYYVQNKSHTQIVFIPGCGQHHQMHLVGTCLSPGSWKGGRKNAYQTFSPAHLLFLTWNRVGLPEGLGVCFCWFHSGGEVVQGGLEGWAGAAAGARERERARGSGRVEPPVTVGC